MFFVLRLCEVPTDLKVGEWISLSLISTFHVIRFSFISPHFHHLHTRIDGNLQYPNAVDFSSFRWPSSEHTAHLNKRPPVPDCCSALWRNLRAGKTSSLDQELRGLSGIVSVGQMSHDIGTILANGVAGGTELLNLAAGQLTNALHLQWVTEQHGTRDLVSGKAVGGVVDNHSTLGVSGNNDLRVGALLERLLDQASHGGTTISTHGSITLFQSNVLVRKCMK